MEEGLKINIIPTAAANSESMGGDLLKEIVTKFNANGNGKMSYSEMKELLLLFPVSTEEEVDRVVAEMDGDSDGVISFNQFIGFLGKEEIRYPIKCNLQSISLTSMVQRHAWCNSWGVEFPLLPLRERPIPPENRVTVAWDVEKLERELENVCVPITDGADRKVHCSAIPFCLGRSGYVMHSEDLQCIMTNLIMDAEENGEGGAVDLKQIVSFFKKEVFFRSAFEWYYGKESESGSNHLPPLSDRVCEYYSSFEENMLDWAARASQRFYDMEISKIHVVDGFPFIGGGGGISKYMEKLEKAFRRFDTDRDGRISAMGMKSVLSSLGLVISLEEAQRITAKIDQDGDGLVDIMNLAGLFCKRDLRIDIDASSVLNQIPQANPVTENEKWMKRTEILLPITALGAHATTSILSKATSAAGFIACVIMILLRGTTWEAKTAARVLAKFAAAACMAAVLTSLANDLPRDYAWIVVVLAFVIPLGAVSFA